MTLALQLSRHIRNRWFARRLRHALAEVYNTAPLTRGEQPFITLSMVQHKDLAAYLVAIKSFSAFLHPSRIIILCDPSMTPADQEMLRNHIPHAEIHDAIDFRYPQLPSGGTWERLHALTKHAATDYVVQLDADTVTLAPLPEVADAIAKKTGFVLNGFLPGDEEDDEPATGLVTLGHASSYAQRWPPRHVQALAEQQLMHAGLNQPYYVRGCSGFTGFPPDPAHSDRLLDFSAKMRKLLGARWNEWGTEQVASNYLIANAAGSRLLPMPTYSAPGQSLDRHAFIHFIGPTRTINSLYETAARRAIGCLPRA